MRQETSDGIRGQRAQGKVDAVDGNEVPNVDSKLTVATQMSLIQLVEVDAKNIHFLLHKADNAVSSILMLDDRNVSAIVLQTAFTSFSVTVSGGVNFRMWGSY